MKNHGQIERVRVLDLQKQSAVDLAPWIGLGDQLIQLFDAAQRVLVGRVAVEELMLDQAVERAKLGQIMPKEADAVHLA